MSCGLKVLASDVACHGIEQCRRVRRWYRVLILSHAHVIRLWYLCCRLAVGHGYLLASGIPTLLGDIVQTVTAEGENYVLSLQTTRGLLKALGDYRAGTPLPEAMSFFAEIDQLQSLAGIKATRVEADWLNPQTYVAAFRQRFLFLLGDMERRVQGAKSVAAGIQNHSMASYRLSMAYSKLILVSTFVDAVASPASFSQEPLSNPQLLDVTRLLCHLFALTQLEGDAGEFMESGAMQPQEMTMVRTCIESLLPQIRPHAVVLVDAFNFSDHSLNSALGRYDGRVYEALYQSAQLDPVNQASDRVALTELLQPIRETVKARL
ncbi:hypothetical protein PINS_up001878 [Pythium insidiosum]|nr:hypothetical protein PINS_up001878 [Pythium insidiosum]